MRTVSVALDLGSTRIKAARLGGDGRLSEPLSEPAPPLRGDPPLREGDPVAYRDAAARVLARALRGLPAATPVGIASQRSTFLLWERDGGRPVTPMISWQDRRAAEWCARHAGDAERIAARTGLVLSPHYLGPKLATLLEADAALRARARRGDLRLGTLDTWVLGSWSEGDAHRTDPTMAARTMLFDLDRGEWGPELLHRFGVPDGLLADVRPSVDGALPLAGGGALRATLADQASGVLATAAGRTDAAVVNLGTGTFVLRPTRHRDLRPPGYLAGPALVREGRPTLWALEGPVNGGATALAGLGHGPTALPAADPAPHAFCLPDAAGVGAPHWRGDVPLTFSDACEGLAAPDRRRVVLEGLVFRVREILEGLFPDSTPRAVLLSGGLAHEPFLPAALAAALGRPVTVHDERQATLLGVARLAAGRGGDGSEEARAHGDGASGAPATGADERVDPVAGAAWLPAKYQRWREWIRSILSA